MSFISRCPRTCQRSDFAKPFQLAWSGRCKRCYFVSKSPACRCKRQGITDTCRSTCLDAMPELNVCSLDTDMCQNAAEGGHLNFLWWARANGCPWNKNTCQNAISIHCSGQERTDAHGMNICVPVQLRVVSQYPALVESERMLMGIVDLSFCSSLRSSQVSPCLRYLCARPEQGICTWLHYHESLLASISIFSFEFFIAV